MTTRRDLLGGACAASAAAAVLLGALRGSHASKAGRARRARRRAVVTVNARVARGGRRRDGTIVAPAMTFERRAVKYAG